MKKLIFFLALFATCLANAATIPPGSNDCARHEIAINDNYSQTVAVIDLSVPCVVFTSVSPDLAITQGVPEVTLITYTFVALSVPTLNAFTELRQSLLSTQFQTDYSLCIPEPDVNVRIYILNRQLALKTCI